MTRGNLRRTFTRVVAPLLLVVAAGTILFRNALFRSETFYERDLTGYYRPAKSLLVPLARSSEGWPLWNPYFSSGQPFAANPEHEIFHPLTALFFVVPFEWAFRLQVILPIFLAAGGMFFLLRTLRRSPRAALFGALVWGFGGYTLSVTNLLPILFAVSALPLFLGFAALAFRRDERQFVAGLAVAFGLVCLRASRRRSSARHPSSWPRWPTCQEAGARKPRGAQSPGLRSDSSSARCSERPLSFPAST